MLRVAGSSGTVNLILCNNTSYHEMEVMYSIEYYGRLHLTDGCKDFVAESGLQIGDVVMVMFYRR